MISPKDEGRKHAHDPKFESRYEAVLGCGCGPSGKRTRMARRCLLSRRGQSFSGWHPIARSLRGRVSARGGRTALNVDRLATLEAAVADIRPHVGSWIKLLEAHVASLPPDGPAGSGDADRSYAEHELRAMRRDLGALLAAAS